MVTIPLGLLALLRSYGAALLAAAIALGGGWACREKERAAYRAAVATVAAGAGWVALLPRGGSVHGVLAPGGGIAVLVVPTFVVAGCLAAAAWKGGRLGRWLPALGVVFAGWWLARWAAPVLEFWRVWVSVLVAYFVLGRLTGGRPDRALASALALWGGLAVIGSAGWMGAASAAVASCLAMLATSASKGGPTTALALLILAIDLSQGRAMRGHFNAADLGCLFALAAPWVAGWLAPRVGARFGAAGPAIGAAGAAALTAGALWLLHRGALT